MMALIIAVAMVLSTMSISVFAASNTAKTLDPYVEITGLDEGDVVNFYKVIEWDQSSGWKVTSAFENLANTGKVDGVVVGYNEAKGEVEAIKADVLKYIAGIAGDGTNPEIKGRINSELAAKIAALKPGTVANTMTVAEEGTSVKWQEVTGENPVAAPEAGLYMALVTPKTAGNRGHCLFLRGGDRLR